MDKLFYKSSNFEMLRIRKRRVLSTWKRYYFNFFDKWKRYCCVCDDCNYM